MGQQVYYSGAGDTTTAFTLSSDTALPMFAARWVGDCKSAVLVEPSQLMLSFLQLSFHSFLPTFTCWRIWLIKINPERWSRWCLNLFFYTEEHKISQQTSEQQSNYYLWCYAYIFYTICSISTIYFYYYIDFVVVKSRTFGKIWYIFSDKSGTFRQPARAHSAESQTQPQPAVSVAFACD